MPDELTPDATTTGDTTGAAWLSVAAASAALKVSPKTVWRRARRGELTARKVKGARGVLVWEIAVNQCGQSMRPTGQTIPATIPDKRPQSPENEREQTGQPMRPITGQPANVSALIGRIPDDDTGARFMAHLEAENKFLREALEQRDRDAAELRAALRAALSLTAKASAPQLTAGDGAPMPTDGPQRAPTGAAGSSGPTTANGQQRGAEARETAPITYDSIADEIERGMNR